MAGSPGGRSARRPPCDDLSAAAVSTDHDRSAAEQGFERHQSEDLVTRRIDDHVCGGERVESAGAASSPCGYSSVEPRCVTSLSAAAPEPMSLPAMTRTVSCSLESVRKPESDPRHLCAASACRGRGRDGDHRCRACCETGRVRVRDDSHPRPGWGRRRCAMRGTPSAASCCSFDIA